MLSDRKKRFEDCQRIQVAKEVQGSSQTLRISVERYDEKLGWYTAGGLTFPLHQLPLLQQALEEMSCTECADCMDRPCRGKMITFPLLANQPPAELTEA